MIKTFIIAALSADGFIAKDQSEPSTRWTSKEDTGHFIDRTKKAGVVILGSKTFETFGARPLKERRTIVYSRNKKYKSVETTDEPPKELLKRLEKEGVSEVAIAGGSSIYTMFAENQAVDKLILTVEGVVFGSGIPLFNKKLDIKIRLIDHKKIGPNTVVLEYNVVKNQMK
jgi:dihydrofolate reductase